MTEAFTPTTEQVKDSYIYDLEYEYRHPDDSGYHYTNRAAFDRWLNKIKAEAWEEGHLACYNGETVNPYRTEE